MDFLINPSSETLELSYYDWNFWRLLLLVCCSHCIPFLLSFSMIWSFGSRQFTRILIHDHQDRMLLFFSCRLCNASSCICYVCLLLYVLWYALPEQGVFRTSPPPRGSLRLAYALSSLDPTCGITLCILLLKTKYYEAMMLLETTCEYVYPAWLQICIWGDNVRNEHGIFCSQFRYLLLSSFDHWIRLSVCDLIFILFCYKWSEKWYDCGDLRLKFYRFVPLQRSKFQLIMSLEFDILFVSFHCR